MSKNNFIIVKVLNWEKYQRTEKNKKFSTIFSVKITTNFFEDPKIMRLNRHGKLLFLYLILHSGQQNDPFLQINYQILRNILQISVRNLTRAFAQIEQFKLVEIFCDDDQIHILKENKIKENKKEIAPPIASISLKYGWDLDAIYQHYPRKKGKSPGLKKLTRIVTDQKLYDEILTGVKNYAEDCRIKKTEEVYIKQFSSFINQETWIEYQDPIKNPKLERDRLVESLNGGENV